MKPTRDIGLNSDKISATVGKQLSAQRIYEGAVQLDMTCKGETAEQSLYEKE